VAAFAALGYLLETDFRLPLSATLFY